MTELSTIDPVALTTVAGGAPTEAERLRDWQAKKGFDNNPFKNAMFCLRFADRYNSRDDAVRMGAPPNEEMCGISHQLGQWRSPVGRE